MRVMSSNKVITVPSPGLINANTVESSHDGSQLAFVAQLPDTCKPGDATPAAFGTHDSDRYHYTDLRWDLLKDDDASRPDGDHPASFPEDLPRWCIRLHGKPQAVVLDPFMGTGTTLVAAAREGARGIGIDMDPAYVAIARQRLAEALTIL